jgi:hypothetical protein
MTKKINTIQVLDKREHWWIKIPLAHEKYDTWADFFAREKYNMLCRQKAMGASELANTEFQIGTCPSLLLASPTKQNMDSGEFLLLPICPIMRQSFVKEAKKPQDPGTGIKMRHSIPTQPTNAMATRVQMIKIWLETGVNYKAVLAYMGGFVVYQDLEQGPVISSLQQQRILYDPPLYVEGRTYVMNQMYKTFITMWKQVYPNKPVPSELSLLQVFNESTQEQ